ncbi:MAG: hypothetical protein AB1540_01390 [Bdellovibrionota bacterium]
MLLLLSLIHATYLQFEKLFRETLKYAAQASLISGFITSMVLVAVSPYHKHFGLRRYLRLFYLKRKYCLQAKLTVLVLHRTRRILAPVAWITRFKITCRQFARLVP